MGEAVDVQTLANTAAGSAVVFRNIRQLNWESVRPTKREMCLGSTLLFFWILVFACGATFPTAAMREAMIATFTHVATTQPMTTVSVAPASASASTRLDARTDLGSAEVVCYFLVNLLAFTVTNLFFLSLFSAFLGCMARRWSTPFLQDRSSAGSARGSIPVNEGSIDADQGPQRKPLDGRPGDSLICKNPSYDSQQKMTHASSQNAIKQSSDDEEWAFRDVRRAYVTATLRGFLAYMLIVAGYLVVIPEGALANTTPGQYIRLAGVVSSLAFLVGYEPRSLAQLFKSVFSANGQRESK
jgi:hypothetical protein